MTLATNMHAGVVLRGRPLPTDRAAVMAIVNRTPDSFFDAGGTLLRRSRRRRGRTRRWRRARTWSTSAG